MPDVNNLKYDPERKAIVGEDAHLEDENRDARIKEIANRYPPYNVRELMKGIRGFREQIDVHEGAIRDLRRKITEYQQLKKQCEKRDEELAPLLDG